MAWVIKLEGAVGSEGRTAYLVSAIQDSVEVTFLRHKAKHFVTESGALHELVIRQGWDPFGFCIYSVEEIPS